MKGKGKISSRNQPVNPPPNARPKFEKPRGQVVELEFPCQINCPIGPPPPRRPSNPPPKRRKLIDEKDIKDDKTAKMMAIARAVAPPKKPEKPKIGELVERSQSISLTPEDIKKKKAEYENTQKAKAEVEKNKARVAKLKSDLEKIETQAEKNKDNIENDKAMGAAVKADVEMIKTMVEKIETEVSLTKAEAENDNKSKDTPKDGPSNENEFATANAKLNESEMGFLKSLLKKPSTSKNIGAVDPHEADTIIINREESNADEKNFDEVEFAFLNADEEPDESEEGGKIVHFHKY